MSVFTKVEKPQLDEFLTHYTIGKCIDFRPIAAGVTNTNYFLDTDTGGFVLTLYEHHSDDELDYILGLQRHLVNRGVRCSSPVTDRRGEFYSMLNHRPAAIIQRLDGDTSDNITQNQCEAIASELARFHLAGQEYNGYRPNPRGFDWLIAVRDMLDAELDSNDHQLISIVLQEYQRLPLEQLPAGPIHADLFHDNALFIEEKLGGILDFDYACHDSFVFDLATTINDWCTRSDGALDSHLTDSLLQSYQKERVLSDAEIDALPVMLRITALRFWLSRLYDKVFPLSGELTFIKDPEEFRHLLSLHLARDLSDSFIFAT